MEVLLLFYIGTKLVANVLDFFTVCYDKKQNNCITTVRSLENIFYIFF